MCINLYLIFHNMNISWYRDDFSIIEDDFGTAVAVQIGALTAGVKAAGVVVRRRGGEAGQHKGPRGLHDGAAYARAQPIEDSCIFEDVADLAGRGACSFCVCVMRGLGGCCKAGAGRMGWLLLWWGARCLAGELRTTWPTRERSLSSL